eukprot:14894646-Heterocapsa_arctica.AAC.1
MLARRSILQRPPSAVRINCGQSIPDVVNGSGALCRGYRRCRRCKAGFAVAIHQIRGYVINQVRLYYLCGVRAQHSCSVRGRCHDQSLRAAKLRSKVLWMGGYWRQAA